MTQETILQLKEISKEFFDGKRVRRVLVGINFSICPRQFTIIAGPSGSGKTTLLSIMGLILKPTEGEVFIRGNKVNNYTENDLATFRLKNFGFVFQLAELIPALSVIENILIAYAIQGKSVSSVMKSKATELLEGFGLKDYIDAAPQQLSSGQKQRVAIARALINDPLLLFCDEPTSALDAETSSVVLDTLKQLSKDRKRGVVMVTHDPRVFPYADRLIKIENGTIGYDSLKEGKGVSVQ